MQHACDRWENYKILVGRPNKERRSGESKHSWEEYSNRILQQQGEKYGMDSSGSGFRPDDGLSKNVSI
jgi:hypothetical protein